jgi:hypothetical protein
MDFDIVLINILFFFAFDNIIRMQTGTDTWSMLAIFLTYCVERFFRWLRGTLGEANLAKKTFTDERFMI